MAGPIQGFGKLWQKTYRVASARLPTRPRSSPPGGGTSGRSGRPAAASTARSPGLAPGEVALLNLTMPGGLELSTGVLVLYADEEGFTLMTPEGHQFAGWITFSASADAEAGTLAQTQVLMRSSDPLYELGMALGGHRVEDRFWAATLTALAAGFGVVAPDVDAAPSASTSGGSGGGSATSATTPCCARLRTGRATPDGPPSRDDRGADTADRDELRRVASSEPYANRHQ